MCIVICCLNLLETVFLIWLSVSADHIIYIQMPQELCAIIYYIYTCAIMYMSCGPTGFSAVVPIKIISTNCLIFVEDKFFFFLLFCLFFLVCR